MYKIISETNAPMAEHKINTFLEKGYNLYGELQVTTIAHNSLAMCMYTQVMVKYEPVTKALERAYLDKGERE